MRLIKQSHPSNQFFICTHSHIVVRELADTSDSKLFCISKEGIRPESPSKVCEVPKSHDARVELLAELGYEFSDFGLHAAWLFLEEASAETVMNKILMPLFVPELEYKLRTFSSKGVDALGERVGSFLQLVTFIHLEPAYKNRLWVVADGDELGKAEVGRIGSKFKYLPEWATRNFQKVAFEYYYPERFGDEAKSALSVVDKDQRKQAKWTLLEKVLIPKVVNSDSLRIPSNRKI